MGTVLATANAAAGLAEPKPLSEALVTAFEDAALSCPHVTPARLAGQVMPTTGFEATADGGIGGLSAEQWEKWKPATDASPDDEAASLLALAYLTCDLVGQVRAAGVPGDLWLLAVAAFHSSIVAVKLAGGVPNSVAVYVKEVEEHAAWYAAWLNPQPPTPEPTRAALAQATGAVSTPSPTLTPSPTSTPSTPSASPTTAPAPTLILRYDGSVTRRGCALVAPPR